MNPELSDLLLAHERELEVGAPVLTPGDPARAAVLGRVRRVRRTRAAVQVGGALAVAAAVGVGAVLVVRQPVVPVGPSPSVTTPAPSPTPTARPTSAPTPTPPPTPTAPAVPDPGFAGTVTVDPHLPSAQAITPEVWARAGSGWVLASYQEADGEGRALGPQVVYLISPDGIRYQLTEVPGARVDVLAWRPGETTALARTYDRSTPSWSPSTVRLDLRTGAVTATKVDLKGPFVITKVPLADGRVPVADGADRWVGVAADGTVSPDGSLVAPGALAAARARYPGDTCVVQARYDPDSVLVDCRAPVGDVDPAAQWPRAAEAPVLVRAWETGAVEVLATLAPPADPYPFPNVATLAGGVPVYEGDDLWSGECPSGVYAVAGGHSSLLPGVAAAAAQLRPSPYQTQANAFSVVGVSGTSVYTVDVAGCSGDPEPATLVRDDVASGTFVELVPYPAAATTDPAGWVAGSLNGWYVVP